MEKKIPVKTLYLLLVIAVGLVVLGVGSTYAVFTAGAEINNPIVFSSNLSYNGDLIETISVDVPAGTTVSTTLNITNSSSSSLNYVAWYLNQNLNIEFGTRDGNTTGSLSAGDGTSIMVNIRNNTSDDVTIILGISSSTSSVVLSSEMVVIPEGELSDISLQGAALYITNLYLNNNPKEITQSGSGDKYYYASSVNLMNDGFDSEGNRTNSKRKGNIRYYGANPDNYIYFNCSTYDDQNDNTCEKWRIIGVFDGKLKIMRDASIGNYALDNNTTGSTEKNASGTYDNNWSDSTLQVLLNNEYYNNMGIITKLLISESTWNLGGSDGNTARIYPSARYIAERSNSKHSNYKGSISWTGNIGLMYASDYGYAGDLTQCSSQLLNYDAAANAGCRTANWMFDSSNDKWTISPYAMLYAWSSRAKGPMALDNTVNMLKGVHPVVYLNSDIVIAEGNGSSDSPYKIYNQNIDRGRIKDYITKLYVNNKPEQIIQYGEDETTEIAKYYYSYMDKERTWGLMNDGLGATVKDTAALVNGTQGNIRYYGATPKNYIYFNCDNYSNQDENTCERWRIIGIVDGKVKIIRDESIGDYAWDYTSTDYTGECDNNWHDSTLQVLLNNGYYNNLDGVSYYDYNDYGESKIINFKTDKKGIKNDKTREMISESTWYLGGYSGYDYIYTNDIYIYERGDIIGANTNKTWIGNIALMYPSDYGYALDLSLCNLPLNYSLEVTINNCKVTNWLFENALWLLTPVSENYGNESSWSVQEYVAVAGPTVDNDLWARPTLYLDSKLVLDEIGDGSYDTPYQIAVS